MNECFITGIELSQEPLHEYPFSIPSVKAIDALQFDTPVTFLVGENGSGKSTIIEAIAVTAGFNAEGGTKNYNFSTQNTTSELSQAIILKRGFKREKSGYFLRAETFYTTANYADTGMSDMGDVDSPLYFDGKRIHEQSHGEAFLSIVKDFKPGLYIFDEPESALSPQRQLALLLAMKTLVEAGSQFIIATHAPILLTYPGAKIYELSESGIEKTEYDDVAHVVLTKDVMRDPVQYVERLFR